MGLSTKAAKTKITAKMCKTLEVFRAWFDITPEPKKCFTQKASKALFSDCNWKIWSGLDAFFMQIYMFLRACHFTNPV